LDLLGFFVVRDGFLFLSDVLDLLGFFVVLDVFFVCDFDLLLTVFCLGFEEGFFFFFDSSLKNFKVKSS
jgi:hypothetical protein